METKTITVCDAIHIDVACERNDMADIKCGGPAVLGYDFFVSPDEDIEMVKDEIKKAIKLKRQPFMGISTNVHKNFDVTKLWTLEKIQNCIKNNHSF